ncbi:MAG: hypothetical protein JW892_05760 [Anaerolineae bacterium]|nr:hypothetical protein [Anaerolineae bacterium]
MLSACLLIFYATGCVALFARHAPHPNPAPTMQLLELPLTEDCAPAPAATPTNLPQVRQQPEDQHLSHPTLEDFWNGRAEFIVDVVDVKLPMGESDTIVMSNGELWSYLHTSYPATGAVDRCGDTVSFPGCTVIYRSTDGGISFQTEVPPVCQFDCLACPCDSELDHIDQQQYPRVAYDGQTLFLVYEYRGRVRMRRSNDGLQWGEAERISASTIWKRWLRDCHPEESIGQHPFVPYDYECLAGGPPGIAIVDGTVYVFMAMGQNPGSMGCYYGPTSSAAMEFQRCRHNPLFTGAESYGPLEASGEAANPYFDFRTISSAEVQRINDRFYMLYEGVRGPGPGDHGDTQFALGLARSLEAHIDGPWEKFPGNPILVDLPGNVGVGHADLIVLDGQTVLYTSLDGKTRSRLVLIWSA